MGGIYDLSRFWGAESDDLVLRCSPLLLSLIHIFLLSKASPVSGRHTVPLLQNPGFIF